MPALLVWGDRDAFIPREVQDELLETLPDARLGSTRASATRCTGSSRSASRRTSPRSAGIPQSCSYPVDGEKQRAGQSGSGSRPASWSARLRSVSATWR